VLALDDVAGEDGEVVLAPRGAHSEKPAEVTARIARMYPDASKCELFARAERPGWTCVGDELPTPSRVRVRGTI
jgi:N6-adenosine-specific RNA methylase IME4